MRARTAVEKDTHFIDDVAADTGQIDGHVKHLRGFVRPVANWLIDNTARHAHLDNL